MQHQQWQELIPFYVAQTLAPDELRRFEMHLASCDTCQQEIDEWRTIASAVWREADSVARSLPPLSQEVYNRLAYRDRAPQSRYSANPPTSRADEQDSRKIRPLEPKKRNTIPLTLVAGTVVAIMFGALLMVLALRGNDTDSATIALNATLTQQFGAMGIGGGAGDTATAESSLIPTTTPMGIIPTLDPNIAASETAQTGILTFVTNTPVVLPTREATDVPPPTEDPNNTGFNLPPTDESSDVQTMSMIGSPVAPTETPLPLPLGGGPYITVTPGITLCEAFNPTSVPLEIYRNTDHNSQVVGILMPNQAFPVTRISSNEWYFITMDNNVVGWLQPSFAYLRGNCINTLPMVTVVPSPTPMLLATATPILETPNTDKIIVVNASFADLYQGPNFSSSVLGVAVRNDQFALVGYQGTGNNRWALVRLSDGSEVWIWATVTDEYERGSAPPTSTP